MTITTRRFVVLTSTLLTAAIGAADSDVTFLASSFETLYRVRPGADIQSWDYPGIKLRAMHRDPVTGTILVVGDPGGGNPPVVLYTLENATVGTPALSPLAQLSRNYGSLTQISEQFYGFSDGMLYRIDVSDPSNVVETEVGFTGVTKTAASAYDPGTDTLYMGSYGEDALYAVNPATAEATPVGGFGINTLDLGAEWFDHTLYLAAQNASAGEFQIGIVDPTTGQFATLITLADGASSVATGLTVIPATDCSGFRCGDADCSGIFDGADIEPFFLALIDPTAWRIQFPSCDLLCTTDFNQNGSTDGADIDEFFTCLGDPAGSGCDACGP